MREHKAAATTAGILYITGTVAGVLSMVVSAPVRDAGDPFAFAAEHSGAVVTGALLVLVMGLSLVPLGEAMSAGPGTASPAGVRLIDSDAANDVRGLVFYLGAVMFYFMLYRSRIVPRWIALGGLIAIPFYVAAHLLAMYAIIGANSSEQVLMFMPLAVQEMVLAVWIIARGFRPAAVSTTSELADGTLAGA